MWANNERILYVKDTGGDENYQLYGVNIDGSDLVGLTVFEGVLTQLIDELEELPNHVLVGMNKRNLQVFDPYRLNIITGEMEMLAENPGNIIDWMTDHKGKLRIAFVANGVESTILYRDTEEEDFRDVLTTNYKESLQPLFFDFENKNVYALSNLDRDKSELVLYDIANTKELEVIYKNEEVDLSYATYSKKRKVLTSAAYYTDKRHRHFFDDETKKLFNRLQKDLGEYEIVISDETKEEDIFIIRTFSDRSRGAYYVYNSNTDILEKIAEVSPWLNEDDLAPMKSIQYTSRDGLTINGYLTLPKGYEPKNLPVVVNPHGGPWARDRWGFNPEEDSLMFVERSPVLNAENIKVPLFVAQGKNDTRVNVDESDQMIAAMKERGIDVEYMVKDNEGHGFRNEENRFDFYEAMSTFLAKHIGDIE